MIRSSSIITLIDADCPDQDKLGQPMQAAFLTYCIGPAGAALKGSTPRELLQAARDSLAATKASTGTQHALHGIYRAEVSRVLPQGILIRLPGSPYMAIVPFDQVSRTLSGEAYDGCHAETRLRVLSELVAPALKVWAKVLYIDPVGKDSKTRVECSLVMVRASKFLRLETCCCSSFFAAVGYKQGSRDALQLAAYLRMYAKVHPQRTQGSLSVGSQYVFFGMAYPKN